MNQPGSLDVTEKGSGCIKYTDLGVRGAANAQRRKELQHRHLTGGDFFIGNLLVRIHFIIVMIWWTDLAPWDFEFPFPGSLTSTFLPDTGKEFTCAVFRG
jgi:hypothetical protein